MANTIQYEVIAVMKSGEVQKAYSTDYDSITATYNTISGYLFKVLWKHVEHSPLDPTVIRSASMGR